MLTEGINNTATTIGGTDGQTWRRLKLIEYVATNILG